MKRVLLGILALLLLKATNADSNADLRRYNALKFGQTDQDYIIYKPDMRPSQTALTVCAWIRRLRSTTRPVWFSYATSSQAKEIQITDDGYQFFMFGDLSDLRSVYTVSQGTWFHNCLAWDSASQTRNLYINGVLVDSKATPAGRTLGQDGYLVLGNEQDGPGTGMDSGDIFGGELYKLNVFSKKLSQSEVQEMATEMCSEVEETYEDERSIKWEDIVLKTRNGDITEIGSGCLTTKHLSAIIVQKEERLNSTLEELELIKQEKETYRNNLESKAGQLNTTEEELAQTKSDLNTTEEELAQTKSDLNTTEEELAQTKSDLNTTEEELAQTKSDLNTTEEELAQTKSDLNTTEEELAQTKSDLNTTEEELAQIKSDLNNKEQQLNTTEEELNSTTAALNKTQTELERVKELLEKAANATQDCPLNSTVTSYWDLLYSDEFLGGIVTTEKLEVLRKGISKLEYFEGIRITEGVIRFLKLFHDGEDQCNN
ncbi:uncharacterized protein LOC134822556 [Bolinopsis microptera]|uniref:uncharacterized protein LOC134822556 n=1 Tax=Bolinopsis microptera TaxID=2820187 RepID=UPI00307A6025